MALFPPSASNSEVRIAINLLRQITGHDFKFKRGKFKNSFSTDENKHYNTWPSATCKKCGIVLIWDTYEYSKPGEVKDKWFYYDENRSRKSKNFLSCNEVIMNEVLE